MASGTNTSSKVIIIGGSEGIGYAIAASCIAANFSVLICGRSEEKLKQAQKKLGKNCTIHSLDISKEEVVKQFFETQSPFDHLITPGSTASDGPFMNLSTLDAKEGFASKFWGQYYAAKYGAPKIRKSGSIIFFSGILARRPSKGIHILTAINSAIEGLTKSLACELAPDIRVNVISPGLIDTPGVQNLPQKIKEALLTSFSKEALLKRVGLPEEVAHAALFLIENRFTTGTTLHVDGGYVLP